ncbi:MAG TPA: glycosyltransferase family 2 protein [Gemmatimonadales bacterium]|nr:glycosyltransferase family 2 protein [Gemmatimonadales bacterium]
MEQHGPGRDCLDISVVAPLYNESANVAPLVEAILGALAARVPAFEVLLIDDGSSDDTWEHIRAAAASPRVRGVRLARNVGQTAALMAGFDHARGAAVFSLDGDLQNDPRDIPTLLEKLEEGYDLVCGWRQQRQDGLLLRRLPSWCANRLIGWLTGVSIKDNGCSLKGYRRELLDRLVLYADQHRFIPALAASLGARIAELPVRHHARRFGSSKYGLSRTVKVLVDLITLKMITTFRTRPILGFCVAALPSVTLAACFGAAWLVALTQFGVAKASALVLPGAALLWAGTAFYMVMLGLVAEVALRGEREATLDTPSARELG